MANHIQYNYSVAHLTVRVLVYMCLSPFVLNVLHSASHFVSDFLLHSGLVIKASRDKITLSYRPEQTHKLHTLRQLLFSNKTNQTLILHKTLLIYLFVCPFKGDLVNISRYFSAILTLK